MDKINCLFLEAFQASLINQQVDWSEPMEIQEWSSLFRVAEIHHVIPMIYEAVYNCPAFVSHGPGMSMGLKRMVIQSVTRQMMVTEEFRMLYEHLRASGITPCIVKGIICRNLYPNPDARMSGDEDVYIPEEQLAACHQALTEAEMVLADPNCDPEKSYEVPYGKKGSQIYIELHKHLFPPESEAYGNLNRYFDGIHSRTGERGLIEEEINGTRFLTMNPTDHLFYLICHSFKHFLHSGFGLRQVSDIVLYANSFGSQIQWDEVLENCREIRADLFAASLFRIGEKYLVLDQAKAQMSEDWKQIITEVDESAMLEDLLSSGVYGQADMSRKHSSNITLSAVIADRRGKQKEGSTSHIIRTVCLPLDSMAGRYPYLKKLPFLLPVAWVQRVLKYRQETKNANSGNNAADSIKIGNQRVELMRKYGVIK